MIIIHVSQTSSTMDLGKALLELGEGIGAAPASFRRFYPPVLLPGRLYWFKKAVLLVMADRQTGGRGQHARAWNSPPGQLYITLHLPLTSRRIPSFISILCALSILQLLDEQHALPAGVGLKWPNDLVYLDRTTPPPRIYKWGGILPEITSAPLSAWLCVGIGINLGLPASAPAGENACGMTSVSALGIKMPEHAGQAIARTLLKNLSPALFAAEIPSAWYARLRTHDILYQQWLTTTQGTQTVTGLSTGIQPDGSLQLCDAGAVTHAIYSGSPRLAEPPPGQAR